MTIIRREVRRFTRIWVQTILPPMITTALYFIIFGNLIGRHLPNMHGVTYIDFIVPGLIMMSVITNSFANVVSSFYSAKFQRFIDEILVSPTPESFILLGYLLGGVIRGMVTGLIVLFIAAFFTAIHIEYIVLMLLIMVLTALLFSTCGFINAMYAKKFDDISIIPTFILTPLTYLGGVFYSIEMLPPLWQQISLLNPIFYVIDALRYSFLGVADTHISNALGVIIAANVLAFAFAHYLLRTGKGLRE